MLLNTCSDMFSAYELPEAFLNFTIMQTRITKNKQINCKTLKVR